MSLEEVRKKVAKAARLDQKAVYFRAGFVPTIGIHSVAEIISEPGENTAEAWQEFSEEMLLKLAQMAEAKSEAIKKEIQQDLEALNKEIQKDAEALRKEIRKELEAFKDA